MNKKMNDTMRLDNVQKHQWKILWNYLDERFEIYAVGREFPIVGNTVREAIDAAIKQ